MLSIYRDDVLENNGYPVDLNDNRAANGVKGVRQLGFIASTDRS